MQTRFFLHFVVLLALLSAGLGPFSADAKPARQSAAKSSAGKLRVAKPAPAKPAPAKPAPAKPAPAKPAPAKTSAVKPAKPDKPATADKLAKATAEETDDDASQAATGPAVHTSDKASDLRTIFKSAPGKFRAGGLIVELESGHTVFEDGADKVLTPASVAKLFGTAAAVKVLDLDKKPVTEVRAASKSAQVPALVLVGAADPTMTFADYKKLAQAVAAAGITRTQKLVVDATLFDDALPAGFDQKLTDAAYRAPIGALMLDASTLQVVVRPGKIGEPPLVEVTPNAGAAVVVINQAQTIKDKKYALTVATRPAGRKTEVVVSGTLAASRKIVGSGRRRVADASYFAAHVFKELLQQNGVAVEGEPIFSAEAKGQATQVIASHSHHDWRAVLHVTNKQSHNQYAETLFKLVGVTVGGAPGTSQKAIDGVRKALEPLGLNWEGTKMANGSGLYRADTITCRTAVALIRAMAKDAKGLQWRQSLAVGGVDGTLRGRLKWPQTKGKVFAKTGTLDDVSGLAGYAQGADGKLLAFAFFFNDINGAAAYRGVQDKMLRRLLSD
ncbi:MAG: D-alanyl-D-alanine carboxypeptidase/D-alanyl-D-alanine-endopeptidase [Myxococcales bacterium]|nr:D-alanyl-D-alanine carboxypeptidase/D-alanyl-D-alanine-endopeptidase [Myxococcales bacterium]